MILVSYQLPGSEVQIECDERFFEGLEVGVVIDSR